MNPDVWPYRVGVRLFRQKRAQHTWNNQAGQTGGNIRTDGNVPHGSQKQHRQGHHGNQQHHHQDRRNSQQQQQPRQTVETSNSFAVLDTDKGRQFDN